MNKLVGFFVGESSVKRQMGLFMALVLSFAFMGGYVSPEMYDALFPFVIMWTGAAFSAKLTKLHNAVKAADQSPTGLHASPPRSRR